MCVILCICVRTCLYVFVFVCVRRLTRLLIPSPHSMYWKAYVIPASTHFLLSFYCPAREFKYNFTTRNKFTGFLKGDPLFQLSHEQSCALKIKQLTSKLTINFQMKHIHGSFKHLGMEGTSGLQVASLKIKFFAIRILYLVLRIQNTVVRVCFQGTLNFSSYFN